MSGIRDPDFCGPASRVRHCRAAGRAERADRPEEVLHEVIDGELVARRPGAAVLGSELAENGLADGERRLHSRERVTGLGRGPFVGTGVAVLGRRDEPLAVVVPALEVAGSLFGSQTTVDQAHGCPTLCGFERDRHRRGSRRKVFGILPAPGDHDPLARLDLGDRSGCRVPGIDRPPVLPACAQLDAGCDRLPPP